MPMPYAHPEALVSTEWLAAHLADPHVRILDASFKKPGGTPPPGADINSGVFPGPGGGLPRERAVGGGARLVAAAPLRPRQCRPARWRPAEMESRRPGA